MAKRIKSEKNISSAELEQLVENISSLDQVIQLEALIATKQQVSGSRSQLDVIAGI